jgi:hypothetical protein
MGGRLCGLAPVGADSAAERLVDGQRKAGRPSVAGRPPAYSESNPACPACRTGRSPRERCPHRRPPVGAIAGTLLPGGGHHHQRASVLDHGPGRPRLTATHDPQQPLSLTRWPMGPIGSSGPLHPAEGSGLFATESAQLRAAGGSHAQLCGRAAKQLDGSGQTAKVTLRTPRRYGLALLTKNVRAPTLRGEMRKTLASCIASAAILGPINGVTVTASTPSTRRSRRAPRSTSLPVKFRRSQLISKYDATPR